MTYTGKAAFRAAALASRFLTGIAALTIVLQINWLFLSFIVAPLYGLVAGPSADLAEVFHVATIGLLMVAWMLYSYCRRLEERVRQAAAAYGGDEEA